MSTGVVYTAIGARYIDEAIQSAYSCKKYMPSLSISIISDQKVLEPCFDKCIGIPSTQNGYLDKICGMSQSPYEQTLFLDTDTFICGSFIELFSLLLKYDIGVVLAEHRTGEFGGNRWDYQTLRDSDGRWLYPLANTGVILYKNSLKIRKFFSDWLELARQEMHREGMSYSDQPAFMPTLYNSDLREAVLPPEYNCRFIYPQGICGTVKILHGRHHNLAGIEQEINSDTGPRIWHPTLGLIAWSGFS